MRYLVTIHHTDKFKSQNSLFIVLVTHRKIILSKMSHSKLPLKEKNSKYLY